MEMEWMAKQRMNSSSKKLWYLVEEDEEEESYIFDMNEFLAIQFHDSHSSNSKERTLEENFKGDVEMFNLLKINDDLFTYNIPLGMVFDEFKRLGKMQVIDKKRENWTLNKALERKDVINGYFYKRLIYKKLSAYDLELLLKEMKPKKKCSIMEMKPDIENMTLNEYLEYEAEKERRL
ncbi:hypothetical protein Tco_0799189 [Tanacetum coccineum]